MRKLVILGSGTAGTIAANKLRRLLPRDEWDIAIVEQQGTHYYQPAFLFIPFGKYRAEKSKKPASKYIPAGVTRVSASVEKVDPEAKTVSLSEGTTLEYDYLVIATGTTPRPDQTPGMEDDWHGTVHSFYTYDDAVALRDKLADFEGGRLVIHITEMPIKCPVAPLEFAFLVDDYLTKRGLRDKTDITFVTPLPGAFTKPVAAASLGGMLEKRGIVLESDFMVESIDNDKHAVVSYDEREVPFDLLVTIPLNMGADFVGESGLGDELNFVTVDKQTLVHDTYDTIFAIGDAANIPTSKAGAVAHYEMDLFPENFVKHIAGKEMTEKFDGHATCFIESGAGKGMLIDFNYETQPLTGSFPFAFMGPLPLLKESRFNHMGKVGFEWAYWNLLLKGRPIPMSPHLSMSGKVVPSDD